MTGLRNALSLFIFTLSGLWSIGGMTSPPQTQPLCQSSNVSPNVTLRIEPGKIVISNRYSRNQISRLPDRQSSPLGLESHWQHVGLALAERQFSMQVKVHAKRIGGNRYCGQLSRVDARLGYDKLKVYIARKYRPGSCHYRSILNHENRHISVFTTTLVKFAPRIDRRLKRVATNLGPVVARSADQTAKVLQQKLQRELKPLFHEMDREIHFRNAKLDTPQNYKKEQAACTNW